MVKYCFISIFVGVYVCLSTYILCILVKINFIVGYIQKSMKATVIKAPGLSACPGTYQEQLQI